MYSPKIKENLIPVIYKRAKEEGKSMTKVVNEILEDYLYTIKHCQTCNAEIETEAENKTGYCEYCESEVFFQEVV
jgi:DNA-directed RNA polymerase subunit RPC12/RpoP